MGDEVFHEGERRAQALAGFQLKGAPIRDFMPEQHRVFFQQLPILFLAAPDAQGWPVATALTGAPGFVTSPDAITLRVGARPAADDPAAAGLLVGAPVGLLGLDFATRRRNRANGVVSALTTDAFFVEVRQSFGNCPQYIQTRVPQQATGTPAAAEILSGIDPAAARSIAEADTFFIASRAPGEAGGFDMSHRGGMPGFVATEGDVLTIPDYRGNRYLNTFGNLVVDDRAGLLFADFATGDLLQVQGRAEIVWGEERVLRVHVTAAVRRRTFLTWRWRLDAFAPQLEAPERRG